MASENFAETPTGHPTHSKLWLRQTQSPRIKKRAYCFRGDTLQSVLSALTFSIAETGSVCEGQKDHSWCSLPPEKKMTANQPIKSGQRHERGIWLCWLLLIVLGLKRALQAAFHQLCGCTVSVTHPQPSGMRQALFPDLVCLCAGHCSCVVIVAHYAYVTTCEIEHIQTLHVGIQIAIINSSSRS
jgi:hypothetical protein